MKPYWVLPIQARVDLDAKVMKGYTAFSKFWVLPSNDLMSFQDTHWRGVYHSAEMQSVYSSTPANLVRMYNECESQTPKA